MIYLLVDEQDKIVGECSAGYQGPHRMFSPPGGYDPAKRDDYVLENEVLVYRPTAPADRAAVLYKLISEGYVTSVLRPRVSINIPRIDNSDPQNPVDNSFTVVVDGGREDYFNFKEEESNLADGSSTTIRDANDDLIHGITKADVELIWRGIYQFGRVRHTEKWLKDEQVKAALQSADPDAALTALEADPAFLVYGP